MTGEVTRIGAIGGKIGTGVREETRIGTIGEGIGTGAGEETGIAIGEGQDTHVTPSAIVLRMGKQY